MAVASRSEIRHALLPALALSPRRLTHDRHVGCVAFLRGSLEIRDLLDVQSTPNVSILFERYASTRHGVITGWHDSGADQCTLDPLGEALPAFDFGSQVFLGRSSL